MKKDDDRITSNLIGPIFSVCITISSDSVEPAMRDVEGEVSTDAIMVPTSYPTSDESKNSRGSANALNVIQYLLSSKTVDKIPSHREKIYEMSLVDTLQWYDVVDVLEL
eukprot:1187219-Ditylum_brightwellii.AAC.1